MVFNLIVDIRPERFDVTRADRERTTSVLPAKIAQCRILRLDPFGRFPLELLHEIRLGRTISVAPASRGTIGE